MGASRPKAKISLFKRAPNCCLLKLMQKFHQLNDSEIYEMYAKHVRRKQIAVKNTEVVIHYQ